VIDENVASVAVVEFVKGKRGVFVPQVDAEDPVADP
jgi:hypothetical protein